MAKLSKLSLLSSFFFSSRPPKVGKKLNVAQNVFMVNLCLEVLEFAQWLCMEGSMSIILVFKHYSQLSWGGNTI